MKIKEARLSQEYLKSRLTYDSETGVFRWKQKLKNSLSCVGEVAGSIDAHGYDVIRLDREIYYSHRLAWFYIYNEWPERLDHIDMNRANNRIINLRKATQSQNVANSTRRRKGKGVHMSRGKFVAQIMKNYKGKYLGAFDTFEEAKAAYDKAARELFGEFAQS